MAVDLNSQSLPLLFRDCALISLNASHSRSPGKEVGRGQAESAIPNTTVKVVIGNPSSSQQR